MDDFNVGDIVTLRQYDGGPKVIAVIVEREKETKCVSLERDTFMQRYAPYRKNRGWFLNRTGDFYGARIVDNPTDDQIATAMHILLTGYVPGVDDE